MNKYFLMSLILKIAVKVSIYVRIECFSIEERCSKLLYNKYFSGHICNTDARQPIWMQIFVGKNRTQRYDEQSRT